MLSKDRCVNLLLMHNADPNAAGGPYGDALQAAIATKGDFNVKVLLEHGANVNARGGKYKSALSAAEALSASQKVLDLLRKHGARY
jgi:ankyrin repeat protein